MITNDFKDKVHLVAYLANKFGTEGLSVIKAVKLIFLADVYAIRNYATLLAGDTYYAMRNGPVASTIDNIVEQNNEYLGDLNHIKYVREFLKKDEADKSQNTWSKFHAIKPADEDYLSDVGKTVLDIIHKEFGDKTEEELIAITHLFWAYTKHERELNENNKRVKMDIEDALKKNDGVCTVDKKTFERSQRMYERI